MEWKFDSADGTRRGFLLRSRRTLAEVGLQEVDGEACAHHKPEHPDALGYYEGCHADGYAPHEDFAGEAVAPVGFCAAGGDAGAERGPEARDGFEIAAVAFALRREQAGFFAQDESVRDDEHADKHDDEAESAGEKTQAESEEIVTEIERIADGAGGALGDGGGGVGGALGGGGGV